MLIAHSWGENVLRNFLAWAEREQTGWTEEHVAVYFNIAGSVLGVPKVRQLCTPYATARPYYLHLDQARVSAGS